MTETPEQRAAPPIIEISGLVKAYGFLPVLRKIDLNIERGEFIALLGPNGSGKSTLLRMLAGLTKPSGGLIRIGGWEIPHEAAAVRAQIGMVSHKSLLYENLNAYENLAFYARLYGLPAKAAAERSRVLLEQVGLSKRADSLVRTYSRGMLQRLSIARAMLPEPHVLLFDEPYTGLDQQAGLMLDDLLLAAHAAGHTIIMTTHQLDRAALLATRAIILSQGRVGHDGPLAGTVSPLELSDIYTRVTGAASAR